MVRRRRRRRHEFFFVGKSLCVCSSVGLPNRYLLSRSFCSDPRSIAVLKLDGRSTRAPSLPPSSDGRGGGGIKKRPRPSAAFLVAAAPPHGQPRTTTTQNNKKRQRKKRTTPKQSHRGENRGFSNFNSSSWGSLHQAAAAAATPHRLGTKKAAATQIHPRLDCTFGGSLSLSRPPTVHLFREVSRRRLGRRTFRRKCRTQVWRRLFLVRNEKEENWRSSQKELLSLKFRIRGKYLS